MNTKNSIIGIFFIACGLVNLKAQMGNTIPSGSINQDSVTSHQLFTQSVSASNIGNKEGTYYLLLCKLQPNISSKMLGTFSLESATKDSTCHFCNICKIEVNVSSIDNKMVINNLCNSLNVSMVTAQYKGDDFFAVELVGIKNIADISFTGIAENKSLLLVNENEVEVISDPNNPTRNNGWQISGSDISYSVSGGNVGIGTILPSEKLDVNGKILVRAIDGINYWYNSYLQWNGHSLVMGNPINSYAHNSVDLKPGGSNISSIYSQLRLYTATDVNQHVLKVQINSESTTFFNGGNVGIGTTTPTAQLHIGKQEAPPNTVGSKTRLTLQPYGHTGGPWNFICRDNVGNAYLELFYGSTHAYTIHSTGNFGIGTNNPTHKLTVAGTIGAREVIVNTNVGADFVFAPDYSLRPLSEVEQFITANKHLPDIAPADSMMQNGVNMGGFQIQLLQKIEELTLYMIEQDKKSEEQQRQIEALELRIKNYELRNKDESEY